MYQQHTHCSFCGAAFELTQGWPRLCATCNNTSYRNPLPVAVVLLPVDNGLLVVRRSIPPGKGKLALPGGFINYGESWQSAATRELFEETGIVMKPESLVVCDVRSAPDSTILIFGLAPGLSLSELPDFVATEEASERLIVEAPVELAFSLHTQLAERFFRDRENRLT